MNKADIAKRMAERLALSGPAAGAALDCMLDTIREALAQREDVRLTGFGSFSVKDSPARTGRNVRTGQALSIPASRRPTFKAGKALRAAVNGG